jgi:hypothetical protein
MAGVFVNGAAVELGRTVRLQSRDIIGFGATSTQARARGNGEARDHVKNFAGAQSGENDQPHWMDVVEGGEEELISKAPQSRTTVQFLLPSKVLGTVTDATIERASNVSLLGSVALSPTGGSGRDATTISTEPPLTETRLFRIQDEDRNPSPPSARPSAIQDMLLVALRLATLDGNLAPYFPKQRSSVGGGGGGGGGGSIVPEKHIGVKSRKRPPTKKAVSSMSTIPSTTSIQLPSAPSALQRLMASQLQSAAAAAAATAAGNDAARSGAKPSFALLDES